ncbi:MAG: hypothetical protein K9L86_05560 [Candidatus Omnitrophica bacterium]|nr:hypothetical protein [Candidatus Omnitrophota bacterium]
MIITIVEFEAIKKAKPGDEFQLKVDFGQREVKVKREVHQAVIEGGITLDLSQKLKAKFCYLLEAQEVTKVSFFSEETNRFYKLLPTGDWPTVTIGSVPMHRLLSAKKDTEAKIEALRPSGIVLDTCMGLGYTAILASKRAHKIITFEKDDSVFELAQLNPVSQELFSSPKITIRRGDVSLEIGKEPSAYFDCIIHDPPTFKLAGELYSGHFYSELFRTLRQGGRLFHYTPRYKVRQGFDFPASVKKRLKKAGFKVLKYFDSAGGFICKRQ